MSEWDHNLFDDACEQAGWDEEWSALAEVTACAELRLRPHMRDGLRSGHLRGGACGFARRRTTRLSLHHYSTKKKPSSYVALLELYTRATLRLPFA